MHLLADVWTKPGALRAYTGPQWEAWLRGTAEALGLQVLGAQQHDFGAPGAVTVVVVLGTSHATVHTWPEYDYLALDVFSCRGRFEPAIVEERLRHWLPVAMLRRVVVDREPER